MSQTERVLAHLRVFGTITNAQAHESYGIRHLPSVIRDIKKYHHIEIVDEWAEGVNRFNENCKWKIYKIAETSGNTSEAVNPQKAVS